MLINNQYQFEELCKKWVDSGLPIAFDTEFISDKRYTPLLCLVQVGIGDKKSEAAVDPFEIEINPLLEIITNPEIEKIVHSGSADLQIFYQQFGCKANNVFDTQIAAAFLGYGHQIGYSDLVQRAAGGPQLSKDWQFSDWAARPLSALQLEYALSDVRYLPQLRKKLLSDLTENNRLDWARAEFKRAEEKARETVPEENLYKKFKLNKLNRRQLAVLRELAITRDQQARHQNKPASYIVPDNALLQLAKTPAKNVESLRQLRGMPPLPNKMAQIFIAAIERGENVNEAELPPLWIDVRPDPDIENIANFLGIAAQIVATKTRISRNYLAPREELNSLVKCWLENNTKDKEQPSNNMLLQDWRYDLLGKNLVALLEGKMTIGCNNENDKVQLELNNQT